jgi:hypothetical protein
MGTMLPHHPRPVTHHLLGQSNPLYFFHTFLFSFPQFPPIFCANWTIYHIYFSFINYTFCTFLTEFACENSLLVQWAGKAVWQVHESFPDATDLTLRTYSDIVQQKEIHM